MSDNRVAAFAADIQMRQIDRCAEKYVADGDSLALFEAIAICARLEIPLPRWASSAFSNTFYKVLNCEFGSWDEAFGSPLPKGAQLKSARRRQEVRIKLYSRVNEIIRNERCPVDDFLFLRVGREFDVGKTACKEIYYKARDEFGWFLDTAPWNRISRPQRRAGRKKR